MDPLFHALASPRRREILRIVWPGERSAGEIHAQFPGVTFSAISQHLRVLEQGGLVGKRSEGRTRYYCARKDKLGPFRQWLEQSWKGALYQLKIRAEMEEARRGPQPQKQRRKK